ncbi:MAG: DUF4012 domain-containing protein, partial [Candidatus Parcubacteria bacterium]|nr:DUF4012 domain-containing protein [Candidatus Parcubacteria bacterium]
LKIKNEIKAPQPAQLLTPKIMAPKPVPEFIRKKNSKLSQHILDLRSLQQAKLQNDETETQEAQLISQEIINKFSKKTRGINQKWHTFYNHLEENIHDLKPAAKLKIPHKNRPTALKRKFKFPKLNFPDFVLPKWKIKEYGFGNFIFPKYWARTILIFLFFALILLAPFGLYDYYQKLQHKKNDVLAKTSQALAHLALSQKAASAQDLYYTQLELNNASQNFSQAQNDLNNINIVTQELFKLTPKINKQFITAQKLISSGEKLSKSAALLAATLYKIDNNIDKMNLTDKLVLFKDNLNLILPDIKSANDDLANIDLNEIPTDYQDKIQQIQNTLPLLVNNTSTFVSYSDSLLQFLGQDSQKRYLLIFQNNSEIRPTGGFIGSYALIDIDQGKIEKIDIPGGGPYDLKAGLKVNIKSPTPLNIMNPRWEFQDANWFADLPTSAQKLMWFYEKSSGPSVDGLIFINASFIEKLLQILGPIELPAYNLTITSDNFIQTLQENVEINYDKTQNKPKQIIADLTPKILDSLFRSDKKKFLEIFDLLLNSLQEKEIQFYFSNYNLEKIVLANNWGGQQKSTDKDFLEIVSTNIAGEKTDEKIEQKVNLAVKIEADGSVIDNLTITKTHTGQKGDNFYGVPNIDYLRIYVPKGSQLLSAGGFSEIPPELFTLSDPEIYQMDPDLANSEFNKRVEPNSKTEIYSENDKTVFANWLKLDPGESQTITLQYKLPFIYNMQSQNSQENILSFIKDKLKFAKDESSLRKYSLLWQKQSGKKDYPISLDLNLPVGLFYQLIYPDSLQKNGDEFTYNNYLNTDKFFSIIFDLK